MEKIIKLSKLLDSLGLHKESSELSKLIKLSDVNLGGKTGKIEEDLRMAFREKSSGSCHIVKELIPNKIASIPEALTSFAASKGREDAKFKSNGATRSLAKAIGGGGSRIAGSLHGLGFAHDLIINTGKFTEEYNIGLNKKVIKSDPEIMHIMKEFAEVNNLTWGGNWSKGGRVTATHNGKSIEVGVEELHHFELKEEELATNLPAPIKAFMVQIGMSPGDIASSEKRKNLYEEILEVVKGKALGGKSNPDKKQSVETEEDSFEEDIVKVGPKVYGPTLG